MTSEVTVIVTTYNRKVALLECLRSISDYEPNCKVIIVIDNNDILTYSLVKDMGYRAVLSSYRRECVAQTNLGVHVCDTEYFVYLNDDMVLTQKDCFTNALQVFKDHFPDNRGFITFNDGIQNGLIVTQGMTSKTFVKLDLEGNLCCPEYVHCKWDAEAAIKIQALNKLLYLPDIKVLHNHWKVTGKIDDVYKASTVYEKQDVETFNRRNPAYAK